MWVCGVSKTFCPDCVLFLGSPPPPPIRNFYLHRRESTQSVWLWRQCRARPKKDVYHGSSKGGYSRQESFFIDKECEEIDTRRTKGVGGREAERNAKVEKIHDESQLS